MTARVFLAHLWGRREEKYAALEDRDVSTIAWTEIEPEAPFYLFIPQDRGLWDEYAQGWSLPDVFPVNVLGFQTHRDHFAVAFTREELMERARDMRNPTLTDERLRAKYGLRDNRDWKLAEARASGRNKAGRSHPRLPLSALRYPPVLLQPRGHGLPPPRTDGSRGRQAECVSVVFKAAGNCWISSCVRFFRAAK